MKITELYKNKQGKELHDYLVSNKKELIQKKRSTPDVSEPFPHVHSYSAPNKTEQTKSVVKGLKNEDGTEDKALLVKVIANMANFMDMDDDVIVQGAYDKSIAQKGSNIPFLKDHMHKVECIIAETRNVYTEQIELSSIGVNSDVKNSQALIFEGLVKESYDPKIFALYNDGLVKQHSIGLRYLNIDLAINDPDYDAEFKNWEANYSKIINKERALEKGFFWIIRELQLIENSAVLFGSNQLTPTLQTTQENIEERSAVIDPARKQVEPQKSISPNRKFNSNLFF